MSKARLSPEEKRARAKARYRRWIASLTPERRAEKRKRDAERQKKWFASLPAAVRKAKKRAYLKCKTDRRWWSKEEDAKLQMFFEKLPWDKLIAMFPGRPRSSISRRAYVFGLRRRKVGKRFDKNRKFTTDPLMRTLLDARMDLGLTQIGVAKRAGLSANLAALESGRHKNPSLFFLRCWAETLGYEIVALKKGEPKLSAKEPTIRDIVSLDSFRRVAVDEVMSSALTSKEAAIFNELLAKSPSMRTAEQLAHAIYGDMDDVPELKIIDVFVCKLRAKIKALPLEIETIWGDGYRLIYSRHQRKVAA